MAERRRRPRPDDHPPAQPAAPHGRRDVSADGRRTARSRPPHVSRHDRADAGRRRRRPRPPGPKQQGPAPTTRPSGPGATRPALARAMLLDGVAPAAGASWSPTRPLTGLDRLDGPRRARPIFAANHHSHVDTPLLLTSLPEPWRHQMVVAAGGRLLLRHPVEGRRCRRSPSAPSRSSARKVSRESADAGRRAARRRLEHGHLPRGRPLPRRLGPALPRRRRLPRHALRRAGRARPPRGHRPHPAQGRARAARAAATTVTFGTPAAARPRARTPARFAARIERAVAALADEQATDWWTARAARRRQRVALAGGSRRGRVAPLVGPRREQAPQHERPCLAPDLADDAETRGTELGVRRSGPCRCVSLRTWRRRPPA